MHRSARIGDEKFARAGEVDAGISSDDPHAARLNRLRSHDRFAPEGYQPDLLASPRRQNAGTSVGPAFRKGSWGAEIAADMAPVEGEIVIEGKRGLDCFASTNLDFILRQRGITHLAIAGFLTNCCVESTMRSAYERGYRVVTLTDCTATLSIAEQAAAIEKNFPMFSRPLTHTAFLAELGQRPIA